MGLLETYIEATLIENQDRYDEARRNRDESGVISAVEARVVREMLHERLVVLDIDHSVMDLVFERLARESQQESPLPSEVFRPPLPDSPLLIDFNQDLLRFPEAPLLPPLAGLTFFSFLDPDLLREAKGRLSGRHQLLMQPKIDLDLHLWSLTGLSEWGDEVCDYSYLRNRQGTWNWTVTHTTMCSTGRCRYGPESEKIQACQACKTINERLAHFLGLLLLYNAGYFQTVVIKETAEPRSYLINPAGRTTQEQERTRPVTIRQIRRNVLVRELPAPRQPVNPRGSWLARHSPDEIDVQRKLRKPFSMRTRGGSVVQVTPTKPKRMPRLKKNIPRRTFIHLYAEGVPGQDEQDAEEDEKRP